MPKEAASDMKTSYQVPCRTTETQRYPSTPEFPRLLLSPATTLASHWSKRRSQSHPRNVAEDADSSSTKAQDIQSEIHPLAPPHMGTVVLSEALAGQLEPAWSSSSLLWILCPEPPTLAPTHSIHLPVLLKTLKTCPDPWVPGFTPPFSFHLHDTLKLSSKSVLIHWKYLGEGPGCPCSRHEHKVTERANSVIHLTIRLKINTKEEET